MRRARSEGRARRWVRGLVVVLGGLLFLVGAAAAVFLGPYALRVERFDADPGDGRHAPFYLYVPPSAPEPLTILVQPNNTGRPSDDRATTARDAWLMGFGRSALADELGVALLVPAFPRPMSDWRVYTHALDRDALTTELPELARLDLQLVAMIDAAAARLREQGHAVRERVLIQGFSASAMFANRFTLLHPDRVLACAAGSPGGWPVAPVAEHAGERLPYPAGVADLEELTGRPFDAAGFAAVPQLHVLGSLDDNDSLDHRDGWDEEPALQVERLFGATPLERFDDAEALYAGAGVEARFLLVEGAGHDRKGLQPHTTEFFRAVLAR